MLTTVECNYVSVSDSDFKDSHVKVYRVPEREIHNFLHSVSRISSLSGSKHVERKLVEEQYCSKGEAYLLVQIAANFAIDTSSTFF
jgi:hypothetical protein